MVTYEEASAEGSITVLRAVMVTLRQLSTHPPDDIQTTSVATVREGVASQLDLPLTELREDRWNQLLSEAFDILAAHGLIAWNPMLGFDPSQN